MITRRTAVQLVLASPFLSEALFAAVDGTDASDDLIRFLIEEGDQLGVPHSDAEQFDDRWHDVIVDGTEYHWDPVAEYPDVQVMGEIINDVRDKKRLWWDESGRELPRWVEKERAIDYSHLSEFTEPAESFRITPDDLEFLMARNHFSVPESQKIVLVGLRGCLLTDEDARRGMTGWGRAHKIRWTYPNHMAPRCVMGVWNRPRGTIRLFAASTVPEVSHMFLYIFGIAGCNLLPTGLYSYKTGTHRASSDNPQYGAFRQTETVVVLRTPNDLVFSSADIYEGWEKGKPADNIHAAHFYGKQKPPLFSSAGCQVISGSHSKYNVAGPWKAFRESTGLSSVPTPAEDGQEHRYVLITGLEAALAAKRTESFNQAYFRVRFGSSGERAKELQNQLKIAADGDFRANSVLQLIAAKKGDGKFESGIQIVEPP